MMHAVKEPLAGLALLVIFGFLIWYNRPNESSRPFDPYPQHQAPGVRGDVYEAWLWKDPFGFGPAEKKNSGQESTVPTCQASLEKIISDISAKKRSVKILAPLVKVTPHTHTVENKEMRTRQRYAVVAGLIESGYRPQEPDLLHFCSIHEGSREYDMRWEHYKYGSEDKTAPPSEKPEHALKIKPDIIIAWIDSEVFMAGKEFLDVDECTAGRDLLSRDCALKELLSSEKIISSPEETGKKFYLFDLNSILQQNCSADKTENGWINKNIEFIRPAGTEGEKPQIKGSNDKNAGPVEPDDEKGNAQSKEPPKESTGESVECGNKNPNGNADEKTGSGNLAGMLTHELTTLRGIKHPSEVIIITEQDSENATMLASNMQKVLGKFFADQECAKQGCTESRCNNPDSEKQECLGSQDEIRNVFYLKGSDGNPKKTGAQDKKDEDEDQSDDKPDHVSIIDLQRPPPLPIGPGQIDYFHRLAEEIRSAHDIVDYDKRDSGAKAAVILGSDFNDKLLIIEALREKMPHLLILTTDLDAQMLYPKHWRSTRNLVVASHFDLLLRKKTNEDGNEPDERPFSQRAVQDQFPPFRDSRQTDIFYRTLAIAEGNANSINQSKKTFPRIFEVGRNGFVPLSDAEKNNNLDRNLGRIVLALMFGGDAEKKSSSDYHPSDSTQEKTKDRLWLLFLIALSLILFNGALRPRSRVATAYLFAGTMAVFGIAYFFGMGIFNEDGLREPLSFTDGVSLWPTLLLQIVAILWAGAFFVLTMCELDKNFCILSERHFPRWLKRIPFFGISVHDHRQDRCQLWTSIRPYTRCSSKVRSSRGWATFISLAVTIYVYAYNDVYPSDLTLGKCLVILGVIAIVYVIEFWDDVSIKRWAEHKCIDNRFGMWLKYFRLGRFGYRWARVIGMWLIFAVIETLLVYLLPPWPLPWRGNGDPASWVGVLSFVVIMLLLFFVLDAVRLNYYWIKKLRTYHSQFYARYPKEACSNSLLEALEDMVEMVAERTQAVDKLIYYPMLCIVLMLFAKITYFDNQDFPLSKGITFGTAISFLFFSGFMLRHEANQLRLSIRNNVQNMTVNANCTGDRKKDTLTRLDTIDEGAFQPMMEQPVMQALLIVLASIGLFAGEYLKLFG